MRRQNYEKNIFNRIVLQYLASHDLKIAQNEKLFQSFLTRRAFSIKTGGDLLSRLVGSIIGADGLNGSVRNGKRWNPVAITTVNNGDIQVQTCKASA